MKTKKVVETCLEENFADWDFLFFTDEIGDKENAREYPVDAAKAWGVSEKCVNDLISAFDFMRDRLVEALKTDLSDIWNQVVDE